MNFMKQSQLFSKTTKTVSSDFKAVSHKLLHQAGFIRESVAGRYYFLSLGMRVRDKIMRIIEKEMDEAGAQKMITPVLHPLELWKETNRTESVGFELMTIKDRSGSAFALGGTAEEMMVDLVRKFTVSYKDLPFHIYQFSQKFRDEKRARGGLLRVREFLMKDGYSFHAGEEDFKKEYQKMWSLYERVFEKVGLKTIAVESDNGYIGGDYCHEFVVECEAGESKFLISDDGKYAAHEDVAKFRKEEMNLDEKLAELEEVDASRGNSMEDGVEFHKLPLWKQIKDVMFVDERGRFILAVIRGDLSVNETKLMHFTKSNSLRHATDEEIRELGSEPGFISPVKIGGKVIVVADDSLRGVHNLYGGANRKNRDLLNVNIGRDFKPEFEGDIALAENGFFSQSGEKLRQSKGIEVGNIFQLGHHYSQKMNAKFVDIDGSEKFYYMGCYGIGLDRTMATIVEVHHDEKGMIWPESVAPFRVHLLSLKQNEEAEKIYNDLMKEGIEVLYDDRDASAGEKFADADLIGIPYRVVVSEKSLKAGGVEVKKRNEQDSVIVKISELSRSLQ
jgi:prolyl-tRNA synthetase